MVPKATDNHCGWSYLIGTRFEREALPPNTAGDIAKNTPFGIGECFRVGVGKWAFRPTGTTESGGYSEDTSPRTLTRKLRS